MIHRYHGPYINRAYGIGRCGNYHNIRPCYDGLDHYHRHHHDPNHPPHVGLHPNPPHMDKPYNPGDEEEDNTLPEINRCEINAILNIESSMINMLNLKLYRTKESDDTNIILQVGKDYEVVYLTEKGLYTACGRLLLFKAASTSIRYFNSLNDDNTEYFIRLDCSTEKQSDVVDILIKNVRDIKEAEPDVGDALYSVIAPNVELESETEDLSKLKSINIDIYKPASVDLLTKLKDSINSFIDTLISKINVEDENVTETPDAGDDSENAEAEENINTNNTTDETSNAEASNSEEGEI